MFPGHDSHVYNRLVSRAYVPIRASTYCTYGLHAAADQGVDLFLCAQQLNTLLVRDEPFTAPPIVRGTCLERSGLRTRR